MSLVKSLYYPTGLLLTWPLLKESTARITWPYFKNLFELSPHQPFIQIYFEQLQRPATQSQTSISHLTLPSLHHEPPAHILNTEPAPKFLDSKSKYSPEQALNFSLKTKTIAMVASASGLI